MRLLVAVLNKSGRARTRLFGAGRQAQCFWCSLCHWMRCSSVAEGGILFSECQSLFKRPVHRVRYRAIRNIRQLRAMAEPTKSVKQ
jgi:hypothetical protein